MCGDTVFQFLCVCWRCLEPASYARLGVEVGS